MTIEEKAKAYDKAIELAKDSLTYPDMPGFMRVDILFPELRKEDDSLIADSIIKSLRSISEGFDINLSKEINWVKKFKDNDYILWSKKDTEMVRMLITIFRVNYQNASYVVNLREASKANGSTNITTPQIIDWLNDLIADSCCNIEEAQEKAIKENVDNVWVE